MIGLERTGRGEAARADRAKALRRLRSVRRFAAIAAGVAALLTTAVWLLRDEKGPLAIVPRVVYSPITLDGVIVHAIPPVPRTISRTRPSRAVEGERVSVEITSYCLRGRTRSDNRVREGIVAADPRIFPLGRYIELFVEGRYYGRFLVDDTGGRIVGPIIDIWMDSCRKSRTFGRRQGSAVLVPRLHGPSSEGSATVPSG